MGTYINRKVLLDFIYSTKNQMEGKAIAIRFNTRKIKAGKIDLDSWHRSCRIMSKCGYLIAKNYGSYIDYTITPKGKALYDSLLIQSTLY